MNNLESIKERIYSVNPSYIELCSDFLILYSRFEYALKECEFLIPNSKQIAMASIESFAETLKENFRVEPDSDLEEAINYILESPPKVLYNVDGHLTWEDKIEIGNALEVLPEYLRRIRNNLLHGSKFYGEINRESRNSALILNSMIIIEHWIDLSDDVKRKFREF